ncbi:LamG-like jellyroll fold domain-containing protein [Leptolyngbya sp. NIES-2104]|uniref:LamG-like jellyroll fold domain-containing protein n=1 Tax=Leptolyngbya sp. NIES-2104 TaxID=1552121 RepID=UPI0006ECAFB8|nr:LamG-like jellyroll fold domain-containing protein [Leptolyngbya sp. NIES-2104]GAP94317.1 putative hemolysin [Leptolyngbya sp. NIES-2104]
MLLQKDNLCHINSIAHEGKVVVFGTATDGKVYYTVRQDGFEENSRKTQMDWENWQILDFPNEPPTKCTFTDEKTADCSVEAKEQQELAIKNKDGQLIRLIRSRYQTRDQTAIAPVQLVSGLGHLYVFRQSITNTLLVDRFVLDGMKNELIRKYEVRFKRSRQKYQPLQSSNAQDQDSLDTLDFRNANGEYFYEPTQEISFIKNLDQGWFSVVLVPTSEHEQYRWHIFAYDQKTKQVEAISLRASEEGRFDVKDYTVMEPDKNDVLKPRNVCGIIRQTIDVGAKLSNGLSATFYYTQSKAAGESTENAPLLKQAAKIMLVMPTERGYAAAINFSIAQDGTLSQIAKSEPKSILQKTEDVLLPVDTLDNIKAIGNNPLPQGKISAIARSTTAQQLDVIPEAKSTVNIGTEIKIEGTTGYNGHYKVGRTIDANTFEVDPPNESVGRWEVLPDEEVVNFDGIITRFQLSDGKLRVTCPNHGLTSSDEVQITGTESYDGIYSVAKLNAASFTIDTQWQPGEVVNLKMQSVKRRGVTFGSSDCITFPTLKLKTPAEKSFGETFSAWIFPVLPEGGSQFILGRKDQSVAMVLEANQLKFSCKWMGNTVTVTCPAPEKNEWVHYAGILSYVQEKVTLTLCKNGTEVGRSPEPLPVNKTQPWSTEFVLGASTAAFQGKIAEVQLWQRARSSQEIKNTMHLLLTGKELDLAGYWRLGAIASVNSEAPAEGEERRVTDFSVYGNDGVVSENAYVSAVTLNRKLKGDSINAAKYSNSELFAVTQCATYEEEFEFKIIPNQPLAPNNVDGQNHPVFQLNHWGQRSRSSKERTPIERENKNADTQFKKLSDGWYRASARFMIPPGVTMLRSFEIDNIKGEWSKLEIRKHRIRLLSNTITEERCGDGTEPLKLEVLGKDTQTLENLVLKLAPLEQEEAKLTAEWLELVAKLNLLEGGGLTKQITDQNQTITTLTNELATLKARLSEISENPLNYWCRLRCRSRLSGAARIYTDTKNLIHGYDSGIANSKVYSNYQFRFEYVDTFNGEPYYTIVSAYENRILDMRTDGSNIVYGHTEHHERENQQWRFVKQSDGYYQIFCRWQQRSLGQDKGTEYSVVGFDTFRSKENEQWLLVKVVEPDGSGLRANDKIDLAEDDVFRKQQQLDQAKQRLAELNALNSIDTNQKETWKRRIGELKRSIETTQTAIGSQTTTFLQNIKRDSVEMNPIYKDSRDLVTTGAFLEFIRSQGRLSAIDSCTGHVQMSYLDVQGKIRQTRYDATDSKWLPDALRTCLNFSQANSVLTLNQSTGISVRDCWTVEAWFAYPLPAIELPDQKLVTREWNTLVGNDQFQIVVNQGKQLGIRSDNGFFNCDYSLKQLALGWHHLAVVTTAGEEPTTIFYLDGQRVGDTRTPISDRIATLKGKSDATAKQEIQELEKKLQHVTFKSNSDTSISLITHIGNHPRGNQPFGKLAEVRVWQIALDADEVEINSKTVLSGNEPGLLAYYPMSDGSSGTVQNISDRSPRKQDGTVSGAVSWFPCAAPIGSLGNQAKVFDGKTDFVDLGNAPQPNSSEPITLSAWIRPFSTAGVQNIVARGFTRSPDAEISLRILNGQYEVGSWDGQPYSAAASINAEDLFTWVHLAGVYDGTNWTLYRNGEVLKSTPARKGAIPVNANWTIGAKSGGTERFFQGEISEVSIWNRALSKSDIQANMWRRLSGKEPGLQKYWRFNQVDAVICTEYATQGIDPVTGQKSAMLRRFFGTIVPGGVSLLSNQRIESLELHWVGNAQFKPTLLGYIEGAPPVPSENLTVSFDYNGATSVELSFAEDVAYRWNRNQEAGFGATSSLFIGVDQTVMAGAVVETQKAMEIRQGFVADLSMRGNFLNSSSVSASNSSTMSDKLELRGMPELTPKFEQLGTRFIPKNVGYALVISGIADVYITRLASSKKMIGYQLQPVEGIEPDINTITFMMNPAYTMNGSLDGMTGMQATSDRFFRHVPQMRNQYGSLYPASYYRIKEAYDLKRAIEQQDAERESYFWNFNSNLVDETSLSRQVDVDVSEKDNKEQRSAVRSRIADSEKLVQARSGLASWQQKMAAIQLKAGKRNIVNTYVWDADGGLRTESQQFASTVEHTIGGSFTLEGAIGGTGGFKVLGVGGELTAQATFNLTQTMTKTESRSRGMSLAVDLSGVERMGITDYKDNPIVPGEKVDRYRFMSFYLEKEKKHFEHFFSQVVDPEWLQGNDEEARALRQVQSGKPNPAWRVMHRVTYIERPALMGFGQDLRKAATDTTPTDTKRLLDRIQGLETENDQLSKKLDQILNLLQSGSVPDSDGKTEQVPNSLS